MKWLRAMALTFATKLIHQTAGRAIVEERYLPPLETLYNGSYSQKPLFGVRTTYLIPVSVIPGAVNQVSLMLQRDSTQCYLSNMIQLNDFNLF